MKRYFFLFLLSFIAIIISAQGITVYDFNSKIEVRKKEKLVESPYSMFGDNTAVLQTKHEDEKDHSLKIPMISEEKEHSLLKLDFRTGIVIIENIEGNLIFEKQLSKDELARFTTIDPMAEKYYSISPYVYVANNPLRHIDPTGMWILVMDGSNSYRYDNGQLYKEQLNFKTRQMEYVQYTPKEDSFMAGVLTGLNDLAANSQTGQSIIDYFSNDQRNIGIQSSIDADINGNFIDLGAQGYPVIHMKSDLSGSNIPTQAGMQQSPFWLDMGHELAHGVDWTVRGSAAGATRDGIMIQEATGSGANYAILKRTELVATYAENLMRQDAGLPLRTHYYPSSIGLPGAGPQLINSKGGSTMINNSFFPKATRAVMQNLFKR